MELEWSLIYPTFPFYYVEIRFYIQPTLKYLRGGKKKVNLVVLTRTTAIRDQF